MTFDHDTLFTYLRRAPFGGRLTQQQVDGVNAILAVWAKKGETSLSKLAYVFATAFHETGGTMAPVREGFAATDSAARKTVNARSYGKPDPDTGHVYYGRGLVQLTWAANYKRMGKKFDLALYTKPDLALDLDVSAKILVCGMLDGDFTGKCLDDYFNGGKQDAVGARAIINGKDKASLIASYWRQFRDALEAADTKTPLPGDSSSVKANADAPALATDKTVLGAVTSVIGAGGAGVLTSVDNLYALIAVLVVGFGALLFLTGRLEIRRKAGA